MAARVRLGSRFARLSAIGCAFVAALLSTGAALHGQHVVRPISVGQKYFMAAHSLSAFIAPNPLRGETGPLQLLAEEAELLGHWSLGVQLISGSTPMQHWSQGQGDDSKNLAKVALRAGGVDIFTMSPNDIVPEEGIDLFGDLMIETNMEGRILVQVSWDPWDGNGRTSGVGGRGAPSFSKDDHDTATPETIQGWIDALHAEGGYLERLRTQLRGIDGRARHEMAYVVPAADAVYRLRQEVLRGNVPGVSRQSELFVDGMGHPSTPLVNLVTYVWFTVMYRQPAGGLRALVDQADPTSAARERLLQQIAWEVAEAEPMSGVTHELLWPGGANGPHGGHRPAEAEGQPGAQDHSQHR